MTTKTTLDMPMTDEENQELEDFIRDWHWDKASHKFARELGTYLFQFIDHLYEQGLAEKTVHKHIDNCWCIGKFECDYGYREAFSPGEIFYSPEASYEYEFKRKMSDSNYALNSYRSIWRELYKFTKALGYIEDEE